MKEANDDADGLGLPLLLGDQLGKGLTDVLAEGVAVKDADADEEGDTVARGESVGSGLADALADADALAVSLCA